MKIKPLLLGALLLLTAASCSSTSEELRMDKLPYFDLKGFIKLELGKLEGDTVFKTSQINGEEKIEERVYTAQEWKEELDYFFQADINFPTLATSYTTESKGDMLYHKLLPDEKGKVKEISIRYVQNYPVWVSFRIKEESMFYSTTTLGEAFLNQATEKLDHYSIETTQKVMFLSPTHLKIAGIIK